MAMGLWPSSVVQTHSYWTLFKFVWAFFGELTIKSCLMMFHVLNSNAYLFDFELFRGW